jgi:hypothetical protein
LFFLLLQGVAWTIARAVMQLARADEELPAALSSEERPVIATSQAAAAAFPARLSDAGSNTVA